MQYAWGGLFPVTSLWVLVHHNLVTHEKNKTRPNKTPFTTECGLYPHLQWHQKSQYNPVVTVQYTVQYMFSIYVYKYICISLYMYALVVQNYEKEIHKKTQQLAGPRLKITKELVVGWTPVKKSQRNQQLAKPRFKNHNKVISQPDHPPASKQ